MKKSSLPRLKDILDETKALEDMLEGVSFEEYKKSWPLRRASEHALLIVSEASRHIDPALKSRHAYIPWLKIADLGNVLRHEYHHVDEKIIWNILKKHIAPLRKAVKIMMGQGS